MVSHAKSRQDFSARQRQWAADVGLSFNDKGYVDTVDANLRVPMTDGVRRAFEEADGSELKPSRGRPPKMCALHSSSALAVNFFEYWSDRDAAPLLRAMGLHASGSPRFEVKFPLGLGGKPPNLDVVFGCAPDFVGAIESKFGEWLNQKKPKPERFKAKYFPARRGLWEDAGLPVCQSLADDIRNGQTWFGWLDAPQLLKHALGLATQQGNKFSLTYLYYDWPCPGQERHLEEIRRFSSLVETELRFKAMSYQNLFDRLCNAGAAIDSAYLDYLAGRYFSDRS